MPLHQLSRVCERRLLRVVLSAAVAFTAVVLAACSGGDGSKGASLVDTGSGTRLAGATPENASPTASSAGGAAEAQGAAPGSVVPTAAVKAGPHLDDADRDFLHHMLDHYEAVLLIVHADMMKTEGHAMHGSGADPVEHDAALDAEKQQMLTLLKRLYGERYSPRPVAAKAEVGKPLLQQPLAAHFRAGIALVDRSLPALERPQVRALAIKVRETQRARLKAMGEGPAGTH